MLLGDIFNFSVMRLPQDSNWHVYDGYDYYFGVEKAKIFFSIGADRDINGATYNYNNNYYDFFGSTEELADTIAKYSETLLPKIIFIMSEDQAGDNFIVGVKK